MRLFPFVPKSAIGLHSGDFWGIKLANGRFACGRVIQSPEPGSRTTLLAALLDWVGDVPPTSELIAGARCLRQGRIHYKSIIRTGDSILGSRPLEADGLVPWLFRGSVTWLNSEVYEGLFPIRAQTPDDQELPVLGTWGLNVIRVAAEADLGKQ